MKLCLRFAVALVLWASLVLSPYAASRHNTLRYLLQSSPDVLSNLPRLFVRVDTLDPDLARPEMNARLLQSAVERQLKQAGVVVLSEKQAARNTRVSMLNVAIDDNNDVEDWYGYHVSVRLRESVRLERNMRENVLGAITWEQTDTGMLADDEVPALKRVVTDLVTHFLRDYQKAHPRIKLPQMPKTQPPQA